MEAANALLPQHHSASQLNFNLLLKFLENLNCVADGPTSSVFMVFLNLNRLSSVCDFWRIFTYL